MTMAWYSAIFATVVVAFPLMYRTARGAFESFDVTLLYSGQTLGLSDTFLFWRVILPNCRQGILAGTVLSFARALGEYGATTMVTGYIPGRTAMISTTVYQLWREGNDTLAYKWVGVNLAISFAVLVSVNMLENRYTRPQKSSAPIFSTPKPSREL
jgi:molybdate transport system permease protein